MNKRTIAVALGAAALAVPAAAVAQSGHANGKPKHAAKAHDKGGHKAKRSKTVNFVFKGIFTAPGTVAISSGNAHVRKGGFVGQEVDFDLAQAKIVADDTNADGKVDAGDVTDGDKVLVQARVTRGTKYAAPVDGTVATALAARKLVDQTHPSEDEATPAPTMP